ncbi:MAG: amidase [Candidatus Lokiarchaeota archaeon]|nr:amidase [Candidatus Lokiarchaeota archaeon]
MKKEDICFLPAIEMVEKIQSQEITSQEITETLIERIERINPFLNAYCTLAFDLARISARKADDAVKKGEKKGLLLGVPLSIKDVILTKGIRTTFGSKLYEHFIPEQDEVVVKKIKRAGGVIIGKTNTSEFGHIALTNNKIFGKTSNPWDLEKNSGGSSGGAAAAVASGISPLALGSDAGGSIRIPSSLCGVFGLKPTFGRIARYPISGAVFWSMDHYGIITRCVKDAALMLNATKGNHLGDFHSIQDDEINYVKALEEKPKRLKIGFSTSLVSPIFLDREIKENFLNSVLRFENIGWNVEEVSIKLNNPAIAFNILAAIGYAYNFRKAFNEKQCDLSPDFVNVIKAGMSFQGMDVGKAIDFRKQIHEFFYRLFKNFDILLTPTTPIPAFKPNFKENSTLFPSLNGKRLSGTNWVAFTFPFNLTGLPAASIPCGWSKQELPIGMQIVGNRFNDKLVLQVSRQFEKICPWQKSRPYFQV